MSWEKLQAIVSDPSQWDDFIEEVSNSLSPPKVPTNAAGRSPTGPELDRAGLGENISEQDVARRQQGGGMGVDQALQQMLGIKSQPFQAPQPPGPGGQAFVGSNIQATPPARGLPQLPGQETDKLTASLMQLLQGG